ncbi:MAG: hypothetical protein Ct9H300mP8_02070 [Gammaproteobacteria bacterium]|nr:MAG: hypothetical protein Ct9H300mP8_02070 [Gammaproteobacteria bacterium]
MDIDTYIETVVEPADASRLGPSVVQSLGSLIEEDSDGPFYCATMPWILMAMHV